MSREGEANNSGGVNVDTRKRITRDRYALKNFALWLDPKTSQNQKYGPFRRKKNSSNWSTSIVRRSRTVRNRILKSKSSNKILKGWVMARTRESDSNPMRSVPKYPNAEKKNLFCKENIWHKSRVSYATV